jgi:hypothetical protein
MDFLHSYLHIRADLSNYHLRLNNLSGGVYFVKATDTLAGKTKHSTTGCRVRSDAVSFQRAAHL